MLSVLISLSSCIIRLWPEWLNLSTLIDKSSGGCEDQDQTASGFASRGEPTFPCVFVAFLQGVSTDKGKDCFYHNTVRALLY